MVYYFNFIWIELAVVVLTAVLALISYFKWRFGYWERKNVPFVTPSIPFGNAENPLVRKRNIGVHIKLLYDELKAKNAKYGGIYIMTRNVFMPMDGEYIKNIIAKDFNYFMDRGLYCNEKDDPLSAHLLGLSGPKWRSMRAKLTPTFTSGKLKMMFQTFVACGSQLETFIGKCCEKNEPLDIRETLCAFATDIIGSCAFGLDCNSFENPNSPFRLYGNCVFPRTRLENLRMIFSITFPNFSRSIGLRSVPKDASDFFMDLVKDTVEYREKNNVKRNDFMQLLIDLKNENQGEFEKDSDKTLTLEQIAAQALVFFVAGFDTSSTAMAFCLYELATHQEIQNKVREEIKRVVGEHDGKLTYEAVMEMKYLGQVVDESLRKYPPAPYFNRVCVKDYKLPNENLTIEKGTQVGFSVYGLHYDPDNFPNPEQFDPDRFSEENKKNIKPFTYMPFGEGPRNCIGMRFGLLQTKIGVLSLVRNHNFTLNPRTKTPIEMNPNEIILNSKDGVWLDARRV